MTRKEIASDKNREWQLKYANKLLRDIAETNLTYRNHMFQLIDEMRTQNGDTDSVTAKKLYQNRDNDFLYHKVIILHEQQLDSE